VRKKELRLMFWNAVIKTINVTMVFGVPPIVTFAVLVPYELTNERGRTSPYITPQTAFTRLSLFNVLRFPLVVLPKALRCVSEAINAIGVRCPPGCLARRSARFSACVPGASLHQPPSRSPPHPAPAAAPRAQNLERFLAEPAAPKHDVQGKVGVHFSKAVFKHHTDSPFRLMIDEFSVRPGELVAVVGRVGAGKSSILQAILGGWRPARLQAVPCSLPWSLLCAALRCS
jgi:hypothetical protein